MGDGEFSIDFADPRADSSLLSGWSVREQFYCWTMSAQSAVVLDVGRIEEDCLLSLEVEPAIDPVRCPLQILEIEVNRVKIAEFQFLKQERVNIRAIVSKDIICLQDKIHINFYHPLFLRPCDVAPALLDERCLSFMFFELRLRPLVPKTRQRLQKLQLSMKEPLCRSSSKKLEVDFSRDTINLFESLGLNCELGFVQRHFGLESLSLLRFTGMPLRRLLKGLRGRFEGLARNGSLSLFIPEDNPGLGYIGRENLYEMMYHTSIVASEMSSVDLLRKESLRLQYLARKLLEDIATSDKIFVVKAHDAPLDQIMDLHTLIHANGKACLLWVVSTDDLSLAGQVDLLLPGLMRGYIDRFAPLEQGLSEISYDCWSKVLGNAYALWLEGRQQIRAEERSTPIAP